MKRNIGLLLLILGIAIVVFPIAKDWYTEYQSRQIMKQIENSTKINSETADTNDELGTESVDNSPYNQTVNLNQYKSYVGEDDIANSLRPQDNRLLLSYEGPDVEAAADGLTYLGTLEIPSINLNMPLVDGTSDQDIAICAGHMLNTAYPGQIGNSVIVGHRGYSHGRLFNRLDELKPGHKIMVNYGQDNFTYTVYKTKVVLPTDTSVINQTNQAKVLTLITCTPLYSSEYRLVIHAVKD